MAGRSIYTTRSFNSTKCGTGGANLGENRNSAKRIFLYINANIYLSCYKMPLLRILLKIQYLCRTIKADRILGLQFMIDPSNKSSHAGFFVSHKKLGQSVNQTQVGPDPCPALSAYNSLQYFAFISFSHAAEFPPCRGRREREGPALAGETTG